MEGDLWKKEYWRRLWCQTRTAAGPQRKRWSLGTAALCEAVPRQLSTGQANTGDTASYLQPPSQGCNSSLQLSPQGTCSHQWYSRCRTLPAPNRLAPRTSGEESPYTKKQSALERTQKKAKGKGRQRDRHVRFALHNPLGSCIEALKGRGFGQLKLRRSCSFLGSRGWAQRQRRQQPRQSQLPTQGAARHGWKGAASSCPPPHNLLPPS